MAQEETRSVVILDESSARSSILNRAFGELGFSVIARIAGANELIEHIADADILVVGVDIPRQSLLDDIASAYSQKPLPIIMFAERDTPDVIRRVVKVGVSAFVVSDLQVSRILSIVNIAQARFIESHQLKTQLVETQTKLADRKLIDKAKGLIMSHKKIDEPQAYASLQKMAMNKGIRLADAAVEVISVISLLEEDA